MKKYFAKLMLSCAVMVGMSVCFTNSANAADIEINNQIGKKLSVAVLAHDENDDSWFVHFWYTVQPNSFRRISFPKHNRGHFWIHAHNSDRSWGSQKAWTVINEAATYRLQDGCPSGTNRRQVAFNSYNINQNGIVRVNYR